MTLVSRTDVQGVHLAQEYECDRENKLTEREHEENMAKQSRCQQTRDVEEGKANEEGRNADLRKRRFIGGENRVLKQYVRCVRDATKLHAEAYSCD